MDWSPDGRVLLFATVVALLTGILCGLAPALEVSRPDLSSALKEGAGRETGSKRRLTSLLVGGQVGVSMLLLILAGLFIRGAQKAQEVDLGFDRNNLQLLSVDLAKQNYDQTHGREFIRRVLEEVQAMPGVRGASVAKWIPFEHQGNEAVFSEGQVASRRADALNVFSNTVGEDYFRVMRIPVLQGRAFDKHDNDTAPRVAVINEALASRLWPGQDPLRRRIRLAGGDVVQVIGVVKTGKYAFLNEPPRPLPVPALPPKLRRAGDFSLPDRADASAAGACRAAGNWRARSRPSGLQREDHAGAPGEGLRIQRDHSGGNDERPVRRHRTGAGVDRTLRRSGEYGEPTHA
jgi:hypothetical protein